MKIDLSDVVGGIAVAALIYIILSLFTITITALEGEYDTDPDCEVEGAVCQYECIDNKIMFPLFFTHVIDDCGWNEVSPFHQVMNNGR